MHHCIELMLVILVTSGSMKKHIYQYSESVIYSEYANGTLGPPGQLPQCPKGFETFEDLCFILSSKSMFPPKCPSKSTMPFDFYKKIFDVKNLGPVWMPVRRNISNGLGLLQWTEPGSLYKTTFKENYRLRNRSAVKNLDCLLYYNSSFTLLVPCIEEHRGLCVYKQLSKLDGSLCTNNRGCMQSDVLVRSKCFCLEEQRSRYPKAEFLQAYQNTISGLLCKNVCAIGLQRTSSGVYKWVNSNQELKYTFWSKDTKFDKTSVYGSVSSDGWILTEQPVASSLVTKELAEVMATLWLEFDRSKNYFVLTVKNRSWLEEVYCFTDAEPMSLIHRYFPLSLLNQTEDTIIYTFTAQIGPGNYWCESFQSIDMKLVGSNVYFLWPEIEFNGEYVGILKLHYNSTNPLQDRYVQEVLDFLKESCNIHGYLPRIMKIIDVNEETQTLWLNVHFTHLSNFWTKSIDEEHHLLIVKLENCIEPQMQLVNFSRLDFCPPEFGKLTWPTTRVGHVVTPEEHCLTSEGKVVTRRCVSGDFVSGPQWSTFEECEITGKLPQRRAIDNNITTILEELLADKSTEILEQLANLTTRYLEFQAIDISLVADILQKVSGEARFELKNLAQIVNNLHKVEKTVLAESESTAKILYYVDAIIQKNDSRVDIFTDNFLIFVRESGLNGLILTENNNKINVQIAERGVNIKDVLNISLEVGLILGSTLKNQLTIITIFTNNALFITEDQQSKIRRIFGVFLPNVTHYPSPIHLFGKSNEHEVRCVRWQYNAPNSGYWLEDGNSAESHTFASCDFESNGHFSLMFTKTLLSFFVIFNWITFINTPISLAGITCIILTAIFFKKWRNNAGNMILLYFALTILLDIVMFCIFWNSKIDNISCALSGALFHYSNLSRFSWMLVVAVLQYRRYVKVLEGPPNHVLLKSCIFGWGAPLIPIAYVFIADKYKYIPQYALCTPSQTTLYITVWFPICTVLAVNVVIFCCIVYSVSFKMSDRVGSSDGDGVLQWRLTFMLFCMLGVTTLFGFLSVLNSTIFLFHLYYFFSTLQGFFAFLFFVALRSDTRKLYLSSFRRWKRNI